MFWLQFPEKIKCNSGKIEKNFEDYPEISGKLHKNQIKLHL